MKKECSFFCVAPAVRLRSAIAPDPLIARYQRSGVDSHPVSILASVRRRLLAIYPPVFNNFTASKRIRGFFDVNPKSLAWVTVPSVNTANPCSPGTHSFINREASKQ